MELSEDMADKTRKALAEAAPYVSTPVFVEVAQFFDRLSPPAPEVDEATKIAREFVARYHARMGYPMMAERVRKGEYDKDRLVEVSYLRTALSELIASKDAEIADAKLSAKHSADWSQAAIERAEKAESELAALRAENERLKAAANGPEGYAISRLAYSGCDIQFNVAGAKTIDGWTLLENCSVTIETKAAERSTAEPEWGCFACGEKGTGDNPVDQHDCGAFTAFKRIKPTPGTNAGAVEVTEGDHAFAEAWEINHPPGSAHRIELSKRAAIYRTEAEARGRREALEEAAIIAAAEFRNLTKQYQKPAGSDAQTASRIHDELKRLMTEVK